MPWPGPRRRSALSWNCRAPCGAGQSRGRIWRVRSCWTVSPGGSVTLVRQQLAADFDAAARLADARERTRQGLLALEHLLHAGLWPSLGRDRQQAAAQLANTAGVQDWLAQMTESAAATSVTMLAVQAPRGWLGRWLQRRWPARLALAWLTWLQRSPRRAGQALRTEIALTKALGLFDAALYEQQVPPRRTRASPRCATM